LPSAFERAARTTVRLALDLLLPPHCLTCDQPVDAPGQFCPVCFDQTRFITAPCCPRCGIPFEAPRRPEFATGCPTCEADPPPWGEARAALRYDDQTKRIILPFKYGDRVETARALAPMMLRAGADLLRQADWLVPVPLHRRRLLARRYNQAALLAQAVSRLSGRPALLDALRRVKATSPLAELSPARRAAEMADAIAVRTRRRVMLDGSRVLLIDDVLTSGATARACVGALREAGVDRVDVLAAARTRSQHFDG
jgi:ComF family protein